MNVGKKFLEQRELGEKEYRKMDFRTGDLLAKDGLLGQVEVDKYFSEDEWNLFRTNASS